MFTVESCPLGEPSPQVNPQKLRLWNEDHRNTWEAGAVSPRAEIPQARQNNHCKAKCGHSMHPSQAHCLHAEIHEFPGAQALLRSVLLQADNTGSPCTGRWPVSEQNPKAVPSASCRFQGLEAAEGNPRSSPQGSRGPSLSKERQGQCSHKQLQKSKPITTGPLEMHCQMPRDLNTAVVFKAVSYKSWTSPPEAAFPEQAALTRTLVSPKRLLKKY